MNSPAKFFRRVAALALVALLFAGCWKERLVWAPDGSRAAVITKDGLHFCDANGKLSPLLASGVYGAAWLADSQRLVLARSRNVKELSALTSMLGPQRTRVLAAKAEAIWQQLEAGQPIDEIVLKPDDDFEGIVLCLRDRYGKQLREKFPKEKDKTEIDAAFATWHSLVIARLAGNRLEIAAPLYEGLAAVGEIRPAPGGTAVAFVTHAELSPGNDNGLRLLLVPIDGSVPAVLVASQTTAHFDWTPDGRTLVYLQASGKGTSTDELRLGALAEREVLDVAGRIQLAEKSRDLAGLILQEGSRVRCLRDGRVLFDAAEFHLPLAGSDRATREQLFTLNRQEESPALTPVIPRHQLGSLPSPLALFEVSPDETQVLLAGNQGDVLVLTLADGSIARLAQDLPNDGDHAVPLPTWRRPGEFSYLKKNLPRNELVLRRGDSETVLSRDWPDAVRKGVFD